MNKSDFDNYHLENFIADESFINYCLRRNAADIQFWEYWILTHPEKEKQVEKAEYYVRNFSITLPEDEYHEELDKIKATIEPEIEGGYPSVFKFLSWNQPLKSGSTKSRKLMRWLLPALVLMLFAGYVFLQRSSLKASEFIENFNNKTIPLVFTLSDGSVITLAPHSGLKYPLTFNLANRKVYLDGEATFQVTTDKTRPFKVFQNDLVATVLGTVFTIRKERRDSVMMVELILGRLKVEIIGANSSSLQPIFLQPNERVIYTSYNKHLFKEKWQRDKDLSQ